MQHKFEATRLMGMFDFIFSGAIQKAASQAMARAETEYRNRIEQVKDNLRDKYGIGSASGNVLSNFSGGRTGGAKWNGGISGSGGTHFINHFETRQNARRAYHETPQARALVERYADCVVDLGLKAEPTPMRDILGLTMEEAEKWSHSVEEMFDLWCRSKDQHRSETMTFYQAQRQYQVYQQRDNDIFVRLYYSERRDLLNPLQFSFVDPNQVRGSEWTNSYVQANFEDGIKRDNEGREVAYLVWTWERANGRPTGRYQQIEIPAWGAKSGRRFMLHGFYPEYPGQGRGYSRLAHTLQEFQNLTDFTLAQIKKAINQSNISLWVKPSNDAPASNPLEEIQLSRGAGPASTQYGSNPQPSEGAEGVTPEALSTVSYNEMPEAATREPGSTGVFSLQSGEELHAFEPKAPSESFDKFVDSFTAYLAASNSMPIEVLLMRFNSNYSASRAALLMFWRVAQQWREEEASDFLNPVYQMWLAEEIAAGRIIAPGWSDPRLRAAWTNVRWIGAPMPNIDPEKTARAEKLYAEMGATTLDRIARDHNGSSGSANRAKLAREYKELPVPPWGTNADQLVFKDPEDDADSDTE